MSSPSASSASVDILYTIHLAATLTKDQVTQCAQLFSKHYGIWGDYEYTRKHPYLSSKIGGRVTMSPTKLQQELIFDSQHCHVVLAHKEGELIGQAFFKQFEVEGTEGDRQACCWITQLVVASSYRHQGIATRYSSMLMKQKKKRKISWEWE